MILKNDNGRVRKVLVIDDEEDLCMILKIRIESITGFKVDFACNAEQGYKKILDFKPDAILLDVVMPGLSGWELCRKIKATPEMTHIPVYICTATQSDGQVVEKALKVGAENAFVKPFDEEAVFFEIKKKIDKDTVISC